MTDTHVPGFKSETCGSPGIGQGTNYEKYFIKELHIPTDGSGQKLPQIRGKIKLRTSLNKKERKGSEDRELAEVIRDMDRHQDDTEVIEDPDIITGAEQYFS